MSWKIDEADIKAAYKSLSLGDMSSIMLREIRDRHLDTGSGVSSMTIVAACQIELERRRNLWR